MKLTAAIVIVFLIVSAVYYPLIISFLFAALIHELGHIIVAKTLGVKITSTNSSILGFRIKYSQHDLSLAKECAVCAAGSIAGMTTAFIIVITPLIHYDICLYYAVLSFSLAVINLLPIRGLDGGAIIMRILDKIMLPDRSYAVMTVLSVAFSVLFWVIAVRIQLRHETNLSLLVIAVYFLLNSIRQA